MAPLLSVPSFRMAAAEFGVKYEGPAVAEGQMPVSELAPALLALGELFTEASRLAYPDRDAAALNIKATDRGSFSVYLTLQSPEAWDQIITLLSGKTLTALANLQAIVFGTGGLLWLMKELRGRLIAGTERLESGHVRITLPDGTVLEGLPEAVALYERRTARKKARQVVEPLQREGEEQVEFSRDDASELVIEQDDLSAYEVSGVDEDVLDERIEETFVTIATVSFAEGYKWRFSEGDRTFTASFEDPIFRERMKAGEEAFQDGDRLRVRMRVVQKEVEGKLRAERTILEVLEHHQRKLHPQMGMDLEERDEGGNG